ncbi:MAG: rRNA maturation RNase YbeY [Bryobacteraceae bacterium]
MSSDEPPHNPPRGPLILFRRAPAGIDRPRLRQFARLLRERVADGRPFQCLIADDRELLRLNSQFLSRDYPADVLSFPESDAGKPEAFLGEVAISSDRAADQARRLGHSTEQEMCILMLHGVLHLTGMDHEADSGEMRRAESRLRKQLGLPAALTERAS